MILPKHNQACFEAFIENGGCYLFFIEKMDLLLERG